MLLRFTVENSLSFHEEASISMIATPDKSHPHHIRTPEGGRRPPALRAAAIYGANGHGKSKLVEAVMAMQRVARGRAWTATPFKLDPNAASQPTKMIMEFRHKDQDYEYGIVARENVIAEEWLFTTGPDGREQKVFERATDDSHDKPKTVIQPGKILSNLASPSDEVKMPTFLKVLGSGTKPNVSFLSEAGDRDLGAMSIAFSWFDDILTPVSATSSYTPLFTRLDDEASFRKFLTDYMLHCDIGIEEIETMSWTLDSALIEKMPAPFASHVAELDNDSTVELKGPDGVVMLIQKDKDGKIIVRDANALRRDSAGNMVKFHLDEESAGTRRMFDLLPMIADAGEERVYVVDELDRKLHPLLAFEFVKSFLNSTSRQLIFTTHNTHLMSLDLLRRDEIWFVQKRSDGSSDLYSLADMKVRNDLNIRKGYISGRFGAVPFIGNTDDLGWHEDVSADAAN